MEYNRNCPSCGKCLSYSLRDNFYRAVKNNMVCKSCCHKGKHFSLEHRKKLSECKMGVKQSISARLNNSNAQKQRYLDLKERKKLPKQILIVEYKRNCPKCNCELYYATNRILIQSINEGRLCQSCCRKSENHPMYKKHLPEVWRKRISNSKTGVKQSVYTKLKKSKSQTQRYKKFEEREKTSDAIKLAMHRPDIRKKHLEALHRSNWITVRTDTGQLELLEKWNRLGFNFEPNYRVYRDTDLFYIDGYDKEHNIVLEYDGKYHNRQCQKQRDLVRQQKIINILHPKKFWRYDAINKQYKNILEG